ncbi:hypothetical protein BZA70DRAFT_271868 [Myxozyma melibiosi]|uniref:C2H2-type domain-containing protein n=1 Tax=Myxozyma melibiosi TaxID=54550 RepID=A0ABR1FCS5_9ASCO
MPPKQATTAALAQTDRPRFACRHCSSTFKRKEHMIRHERSHTAERPYECSHCETAFTRKDLLVRHKRTCAVANAAQNLNEEESEDIPKPSAKPRTVKIIHKKKFIVEDEYEEEEDETMEDDALHLASEYDPSNLSQYDHLIPNADRDSSVYETGTDTETSTGEDWDSVPDDVSPSDSGSPAPDWADSVIDSAVFTDAFLRDLSYVLVSTCGVDISVCPISAADINRFIIAYRKHVAKQMPIIHPSLFEYDYLPLNDFTLLDQVDPAVAANCVVLLTTAALGATCLSMHEPARLLRDLSLKCVTVLFDLSSPRQSEEFALGVMQVRLLCGIFDAWSANKQLAERALDEQAALVRACVTGISRRCARVTDSFKAWRIRESYHRLYWGFYTFMSNLYLSFGDICPLPRIGTEKLPLPESDALWEELNENSWRELLSQVEEPSTSDVALARILAFNDVGDHGNTGSADSSYSGFATCVMLRILLHHLSTTNQVLRFGGIHSVPATIELDYLRTLSFEQVDRIVAHLSAQSSHQGRWSSRPQFETLIQMIKLRRLNLPATRRLGVLSSLVLDEDLGLDLMEALENRCKRSTNVTKTLSICLSYIQPYLFKKSHIDSIEELLCTWESVLCLIIWIRTIEINYSSGISVQPEEAAMIDDVTRIVTSKRNTFFRETAPESGQEKMYLTTRLAYTWCGVLRKEDMIKCGEQVRSFLANLITKL